MTRLIFCLSTILILLLPKDELLKATNVQLLMKATVESTKHALTVMEALDLVQQEYAANFEKVMIKDTQEYYYKLPFADYYLEFAGEGETDQDYLFRLYEFVLDEEDTGIGHTVTYGWYSVNKETETITDHTQY
jgi:hypothetical protein